MSAEPFNHDTYGDDYLREILTDVKTIAVIGASANTVRPSYFVVKYLLSKGYQVFPINPGQAGKEIAGAKAYASLADLPVPVDMVDIFRRSDHVPPVVDEALEAFPDLQTIWMQIGVTHPQAAAEAEAQGVDVVQDRCPKIEYQRLFNELRMGGFVTGRVSSKLS